MTQNNIIGVQFEEVGKIYYFDASRYPDLKVGDPVVVRTSRGLQLATISQVRIDVDDLDFNSFKSVERPATPRDLLQRKALSIQEEETKEQIRNYFNENNLSAVKVVSAEYSLDGNRLFVLINSESSINYNIKRVHQDIQKMLKDVQLELRQIGPRDAAKLIGGMGACGMETRCCSKFLTEFSSISIRMAKTQDISLTPSEITGMCGRLRCCLMYEYDQYVEAIKTLPKRKRKVQTPMGEGRVVQILPLRQSVIVDIPEIGPRQFTMEDLDRAEKIARGEAVEPLSEEKPKHGGQIGRHDDHDGAKSSIKEDDQHASRKRRGRSSRWSKDS
ncbi:MAG TPA: regulatory iron-sulfur-containing complex subunit RicT [Brevefilum sp.]